MSPKKKKPGIRFPDDPKRELELKNNVALVANRILLERRQNGGKCYGALKRHIKEHNATIADPMDHVSDYQVHGFLKRQKNAKQKKKEDEPSQSNDVAPVPITDAGCQEVKRPANTELELTAKRARQREASRRYRNKMSSEQKEAMKKRKYERKKKMLASLSPADREKWRLRQRQYYRNYVESLTPEENRIRKSKALLAIQNYRKIMREKKRSEMSKSLERADSHEATNGESTKSTKHVTETSQQIKVK